MTCWESVNSYGDEFLRWDEGETINSGTNLQTTFSLMCKIWYCSNFFRDQTIEDRDDPKDQCVFCRVSISVSRSVGAKQQIPCLVSFLPHWEDCFFYQGQRQVTNWAVAASSIPLRWLNRPQPPPLHPLHSSKLPTYTQTYTPRHTNKRTLSRPLQSKAYSHIRSIKFTLPGLSHKKNISPPCFCSEEAL